MLKAVGILLFFALLSSISGKTFGIDKDALAAFKESEVSDVFALYDHEANIIFYKDPAGPACYLQTLNENENEKDLGTREIILTGKPLNGSSIVSRFQKKFCSNLPIYDMEMNSVSTEPRRRVHRSRRWKRTAYNRNQDSPDSGRGQQIGGTGTQHQFHWPGSQAQVQGNVVGNGHFSGQAQSAYGGLSQSQIQLGGVGLTGSISSVAGGAQSALRLGSRSGAGQISSSGNGHSASELQLNLGERGEESRAHAMVMQQHQTGQSGQLQGSSGDFGSKQHQEQGGSYRQYSLRENTPGIQQPPRQQYSTHGQGSRGNFQSLHGRSEAENSNYDQHHFSSSSQHQAQGFGRVSGGRDTRTDVSMNSDRQGRRGFQGSMGAGAGETGLNLDVDSQAASHVTGGRSQAHQQNMIGMPQEFMGSGTQGQFRSDSVSLRDYPAGMIPASPYGTSHAQQSNANQRRDHSNYDQHQQQPRTDSQQFTTNGFRMHMEALPPAPESQQHYLNPTRQGGARAESTQEESVTTHTRQQPQYPAQENGVRNQAVPRYGSDTRTQETQSQVQQSGGLSSQQVQPLPSNGHAQTETETQTSLLQQQSVQTQYGSRQHTTLPQPGQRTYIQQTQHHHQQSVQGDLPMMTSYPMTNGRRVYQRRIVTYYPAQITPVSLHPHYVQQSMTGRQPQSIPQHHGMGQSQAGSPGETPSSSRCQMVTFQCTVIFDTNGKSKLCQPKPGNGGGGQSSICCC